MLALSGGLINQVFGIETLAHPLLRKNDKPEQVKVRVFMIRNSGITTKWHPVKRKLVDIAGRTVDVMINSQSIGDIFRNYVVAEKAGMEFYLTGIPEDFEEESPEHSIPDI